MNEPCGWLLTPEDVHKLIDRDDGVRVEEEMREEGSLFRASERNRNVIDVDLEPPENPEIHGANGTSTTWRRERHH